MLHNIPLRQKITIMLAVMSGLFLAALDQTIVATALPKIVQQFNGLSQLSWVVTAYLLTSTVTLPISGKLSDMFGRKKLLVIGIASFLLGSALSGASQSMTQLILFRAFQGIGAGLLMSNAFAVIGDLFTPAERGRWQGIISSVFGLASVIGPLAGGYLTDTHHILGLTTSWRWTFYVNVPIGIIALFLISTFMPHVKQVKEKIDYLGAVLITGGLTTLILGLTWGGNQYAWGSWQVIVPLVASVFALTGFVFAEKKATAPILPLEFFKNSTFRVAAPIVFLFGAAFFGALLYLPLFKEAIQNASATSAGMAIVPLVIAMVIVSIFSGQFISRTGKYKILAIGGLAIGAIGLFLMTNITPGISTARLAFDMIITGIGIGVGLPVFNLVIQNAFPQKQLGIASSSSQLARGVGSTVGTAVLGSVLNNFVRHRLTNIRSDSFVQLASKNGHASQFTSLNENSIQGILSSQGQSAIARQLHQLPAKAQPAAFQAFAHFTNTLKDAFSYSIGRVFMVSALLMTLSFLLTFLLKQVPLRSHADGGGDGLV
jgi:EmrB/QacA subfamily drug resistance transporter